MSLDGSVIPKFLGDIDNENVDDSGPIGSSLQFFLHGIDKHDNFLKRRKLSLGKGVNYKIPSEEEFIPWVKQQLEIDENDDDFKDVVGEPIGFSMRYKKYCVNGFLFFIKEYEATKQYQNSRVSTSSVMTFQSSSKDKNLLDEKHATQVFYSKDPKDPDWNVVIEVPPKVYVEDEACLSSEERFIGDSNIRLSNDTLIHDDEMIFNDSGCIVPIVEKSKRRKRMQDNYGAYGYFLETGGTNKRKYVETMKLTEVSASDKLESFRASQERKYGFPSDSCTEIIYADSPLALFNKLALCCIQEGGTLCFATGTNGNYVAAAKFLKANVVNIPTNISTGFKLIVDVLTELLQEVDKPWVYLSGPTINPTGLLYSNEEIQEILSVFNMETFKWSFSILISRLVRLPSLNERVALVPWADMLNHSCEAVVFTTDRPYQPGEQVFISYRKKSNGGLLLSYGFVPKEGTNPSDSADLSVSLNKTD
ncbi:hypothetical protein GIB67_007572, partial [Kingdonia uniflora]